jgi:hypothetical protein
VVGEGTKKLANLGSLCGIGLDPGLGCRTANVRINLEGRTVVDSDEDDNEGS